VSQGIPYREPYMLVGCANKRHGRENSGFTLIELLVSLSVIGLAVSIYVSLYTSSLEIGDSARNRGIALGLAEAQLQQMLLQPGAYLWQIPAPLDLERMELKLSADDPQAGNPFPPPSSMPPDRLSNKREKNIYSKFRWQAFAQLPALDSAHVNVTVSVRWTEASKESVVALTSIIPRTQVEGLKP